MSIILTDNDKIQTDQSESSKVQRTSSGSSSSSLGSVKEAEELSSWEDDRDDIEKRASFFIDNECFEVDRNNHDDDLGSPDVNHNSNNSPRRRARSQLLQLFTCQNCCKRRRSPKGLKARVSSSDPSSPSNSHSSFKNYQSNIDPNNLLSVNSILTQYSHSEDDDSDGVGSKKAPRRSEKSKKGRRSPIEVSSLLTSILKNRHSPSPIRGGMADTAAPDSVQGSLVEEGKKSKKDVPPIRIWETEATEHHTRLQPPVVNSVLARCARLKNQSLYGSFSFQKAELQKFNSSVAAIEETDRDKPQFSPGHRSLSETSSGSASPYPWVGSGGGWTNVSNKFSTGGKRARFNESVDVIVDDQKAGGIVFKNIVKLKPSSDDSVFDTSARGMHEFRNRLCSDGSDADFTLAALRCRRQQKAFGEARISVIPPKRLPTGGKGDQSKRASSNKTSTNDRFSAPTLRVAIRLKEDFTRDRVFVRTARGGTRLLVGTYRSEPLGDGTNYLRQFVDRYSLPHAIDVTTVIATLGGDESPDDLIITANMFDYESDD